MASDEAIADEEDNSSSCSSDESLIRCQQPRASSYSPTQRLRSFTGSSSTCTSTGSYKGIRKCDSVKGDFNVEEYTCLSFLKCCLYWGEHPVHVPFRPIVHESNDGVLYNEQKHQEGYPIKPMKNLGNTCYLNAIIQCLNQTTAVHDIIFDTSPREYNLNNDHVSTVIVNTWTSNGPISKELINVFDKMSSPQCTCVAPRSLIDKINEEDDQFHQGAQHDSHELLRLILNKLRTEETEHIKRKVKAQVQHKASSSSTSEESIHEVLQSAAKLITPVEEVFSGSAATTVICRDCLTPVQLIESFFDLQLSMPASDQKEERKSSSPFTRMPTTKSTSKMRIRQVTPVSDDAIDGYYKQGINTSESELSGKEQNCADNYQTYVVSSPTRMVNPYDFNSLQESLNGRGMEYSSINLMSLSPKTDLEKSLKEYINIDILDEENKFICDTCNAKAPDTYKDSPVNRQVLIKQLPQVLILQIKRFVIDDGSIHKDNKRFTFPCALNMAPYCTNTCSQELKDKNGCIMYGLYGVIVHNGSTLKGGHYVAYVKKRPIRQPTTSTTSNWEYDQREAEGGTWYCTNDEKIKKCSKGFGSIQKKKAYLLFYELLPRS